MIRELQTCRTGYQELLEMYLRQIFLLIQRTRQESNPTISTYLQKEMEYAQQYFQEHYNEDIQIKDYAKSRSMSVSWFLRNFKKFIGQPPAQYLLTIRMNNAVLIKDHVAGRYDFLLPVEKEVGLSGGHIQQLIV